MAQHPFMEVRNAAHHAAQVPSALGATHLGSGDRHEDANLTWDLGHGALMGHEVYGLRAGLRLWDLTWILTRDGVLAAEKPAANHPVSEGLTWLRYQATEHSGLQCPDVAPEPVGYELPDHPAARGEPFLHGGQDQLAILDRWFATAAAVLEQLRRAHPTATPVRCWPHHFDLATLIKIEPSEHDPDQARSIGVGMTPGDAGIPEPYWYVTPWPYPDERSGPDLPAGGEWNTRGWFGAVLRASRVEDSVDGIWAFLDAAIPACRELLDD